jgi:hypothetical protein
MNIVLLGIKSPAEDKYRSSNEYHLLCCWISSVADEYSPT